MNICLIENFIVDAGIKSASKTIIKSLKGKSVSVQVLTHAHADHQGSSKAICIG